MKSLKFTIAFLVLSLVFTHANAQTADDIISQYITATGGKDKLNDLKSMYTEGTLEIMGNQAPSVTYAVKGKGYKNELDFGGQKVITCYTDNGGWTINPMAGQTSPTALPDDQVKIGQMQLDLAGPLVDYKAKGNKVELIGKEDIKGSPAHKLKLTTASGQELIFYIDGKSYYIVKMSINANMTGQAAEISSEYSDFRKIEPGIMVPFSILVNVPGMSFTSVITKVEVNKPIDLSVFEKITKQ